MARIDVAVNINEDILEQQLERLLDGSTRYTIHNLLAKMCDPYVPFLEGPLSQTVEVYPDKVRYIQPYARKQYYGVGFNHTLDYHPKATALWDKVMLQEKGDEFNAQVREIIARRARQNGG